MKKWIGPLFPFWFALLSSAFCFLLYRRGSFLAHFPIAFLVFFAALGWSAMVLYPDEANRPLRIGFILGSIVLSVLGVETLRPFRENLFFNRIIYALIILGILGIRFYLYNQEKRKSS
jgi:hypothetical protein